MSRETEHRAVLPLAPILAHYVDGFDDSRDQGTALCPHRSTENGSPPSPTT